MLHRRGFRVELAATRGEVEVKRRARLEEDGGEGEGVQRGRRGVRTSLRFTQALKKVRRSATAFMRCSSLPSTHALLRRNNTTPGVYFFLPSMNFLSALKSRPPCSGHPRQTTYAQRERTGTHNPTRYRTLHHNTAHHHTPVRHSDSSG
eukprot:627893-Rhodomonas_salina.1